MHMHEIRYDGQPPIDGYGPGGFRIKGDWHQGGQILLPHAQHSFRGAVDAQTLERVIAQSADIDLILIGQGADIAPLAPALGRLLDGNDLGYELMSTPSACRTYNVLLTEKRRVGAVLVAL